MSVIRDGQQVSGLSFYALAGGQEHRTDVAFPDEAWPEATEHSVSRLGEGGWRVLIWDVALPAWPANDAFTTAVDATFAAMLNAGSVVAWIGGEGYFCDPPYLFLPERMSGGVLAAVTADGRAWLDLDPDAPLEPLSDAVLLELRQASAGLSDVGGRGG